MPHVILFRPLEHYSYNIGAQRPPLGLIYLGTALQKQGLDVTLIDAGTTPDWLAELKRSLRKDTIFAGITCMTGHQIRGALDFSQAMRQMTSIPHVWGGLHPTLTPDQTGRHELVDVVIKGEGEGPVVNLAGKIIDGEPWLNVPNIVFRKSGEIFHSPLSPDFVDMDRLDPPNYALVDVEHYAARSVLENAGWILIRTEDVRTGAASATILR